MKKLILLALMTTLPVFAQETAMGTSPDSPTTSTPTVAGDSSAPCDEQGQCDKASQDRNNGAAQCDGQGAGKGQGQGAGKGQGQGAGKGQGKRAGKRDGQGKGKCQGGGQGTGRGNGGPGMGKNK